MNDSIQNSSHSKRIHSIDILRGLVIVIMALDHVRDFFGPAAFIPEDISQTSPMLFFTRWITHFCAPAFVFLAGTSGFLYGSKVGNRKLSHFLLTRGLWLILIEVLVINPSWTLTSAITANYAFLQVIWVIGISMVIMSALIWLPKWVIAAFSLILIFGHNMLVPIETTLDWGSSWWWKMLHRGNSWIPLSDTNNAGIFIVYPIIPWVGVMGIGYIFGQVMQLSVDQRKRFLFQVGLGVIVLFVLLRSVNFYGDSSLWEIQERGAIYSILSFFNTTKYPPSLLFLCMTLGPSLLLLIPLENWSGKVAEFFRVFGRVPFFFYVIHIIVINLCAQVWNYLMYGNAVSFMSIQSKDWPKDYELNLFVVYGAWASIVFGLYFLCKYYNGFKHRHQHWILKYL